MTDMIRLQAGPGDMAEISPLGAELVSWRAGDVDLVWEPQPEVWPQTAPLLFPVVGWTRDGIRVDGARFPLGLHGFARQKRFTIAERSKESVSLVLEEDEASRALYPFAFRLEAHFALRPGALRVSLTTSNRDARPLPYAVGLHPGFRWPLGGSARPHAIHFEAAESGEVPIIAPGGLLSARRRAIPLEEKRLPLSAALLEQEALCFLGAASRRLLYDNGDGLALAVELEDFPHIALWSRPPAPFLCIEAWTGHGDPEDFHGDLHEKPSMRILAPGESAAHAATFRLEAAGAKRIGIILASLHSIG